MPTNSNITDSAFEALRWNPRITAQWAIPDYNDPWSREHDTETYYARKLSGTVKSHRKPLWVYDYETKVKQQYPSILECSRCIKIHTNSIFRAIKKGTWLVSRYAIGRTEAKLVECMKSRRIPISGAQPIKCLDMHTGTVIVFKSKSEASSKLRANKDNVKYGCIHKNRYKFMRVEEAI